MYPVDPDPENWLFYYLQNCTALLLNIFTERGVKLPLGLQYLGGQDPNLPESEDLE